MDGVGNLCQVTFVDSVEVVASGKNFIKEIQGLTSQASWV